MKLLFKRNNSMNNEKKKQKPNRCLCKTFQPHSFPKSVTFYSFKWFQIDVFAFVNSKAQVMWKFNNRKYLLYPEPPMYS